MDCRCSNRGQARAGVRVFDFHQQHQLSKTGRPVSLADRRRASRQTRRRGQQDGRLWERCPGDESPRAAAGINTQATDSAQTSAHQLRLFSREKKQKKHTRVASTCKQSRADTLYARQTIGVNDRNRKTTCTFLIKHC